LNCGRWVRKLDGDAIYVHGCLQELLGVLQEKINNGVIEMYKGLYV